MNKKYLFLIIIPFLWIVILIFVLSLKGYQNNPYISAYSEEEKKEKAVMYALQCLQVNPPAVITRFNNDLNLEHKFIPAYVIPYESIEHFINENPECCVLSRNEFLISGKIYYRVDNDVRYVESNISSFYFEPYLVSSDNSCY